ncbi:hypothetical protein D3C84_931180 [compost metagenome]
MPSRKVTSCFITLPEAKGSLSSMHWLSILRLIRLRRRISSICSSMKSASAVRVTVLSLLSKLHLPRRSKRRSSSFTALSTALVSSCLSSSDTTSNEGMKFLLIDGAINVTDRARLA